MIRVFPDGKGYSVTCDGPNCMVRIILEPEESLPDTWLVDEAVLVREGTKQIRKKAHHFHCVRCREQYQEQFERSDYSGEQAVCWDLWEGSGTMWIGGLHDDPRRWKPRS